LPGSRNVLVRGDFGARREPVPEKDIFIQNWGDSLKVDGLKVNGGRDCSWLVSRIEFADT